MPFNAVSSRKHMPTITDLNYNLTRPSVDKRTAAYQHNTHAATLTSLETRASADSQSVPDQQHANADTTRTSRVRPWKNSTHAATH